MMTGKRRQPPPPLAVWLIAMCVSISACGKQNVDEIQSETVVRVKTAAASLGTIRGIVHATGIVTPAPGADLVVVAPEAARIVEMPRAVGDRVRRGDLLVRFEIPTAAAEVQRQEAEVTRAQAAIDNARAALTRARELFERGVAARKEVEDATRGVADAEAAVAQARASLGASRALADRAIVRATFDGVIAKRLHNPGDLAEPSASDPVLRVVDPNRIEVVASIPLADASRIEVGAPAHLASAPSNAGDARLAVTSRPAAVEIGTATIPIRLSFAAPADIPAGTPVQVDIDAELHKSAVLVPSVAIVREGEDTAVFVVIDSKAKRRAVEIGLSDGTHVELLSGVNAGEIVIVDGQAGLPDDVAVTVTEGPGAASDAGRGAAPGRGEPK
jgi:RND family efflux transporter MFP subunit